MNNTAQYYSSKMIPQTVMTSKGLEIFIDESKVIVKSKLQQTMIEKYNVSHPLHKQEFIIKKEQTMIKKYGAKYSMQNSKCLLKSRITKNLNKLNKFCNIRTSITNPITRKIQCKKALDNIIKFANSDNVILQECIKILEQNIPDKSPQHFLSAISTLKKCM